MTMEVVVAAVTKFELMMSNTSLWMVDLVLAYSEFFEWRRRSICIVMNTSRVAAVTK
jgi:hypothetical protein